MLHTRRQYSELLLFQGLESLCEGLEGRSSNPVAVLFDTLCHPDADLGADNPSVLEWRLEEEHAINHVVLGKLRPGGAWQVLKPTSQKMMLLGLPFYSNFICHYSVYNKLKNMRLTYWIIQSKGKKKHSLTLLLKQVIISLVYVHGLEKNYSKPMQK